MDNINIVLYHQAWIEDFAGIASVASVCEAGSSVPSHDKITYAAMEACAGMAAEAEGLLSSSSCCLILCSGRKDRDWSKLPTDLLAEILCRLSEEELVRCAVICKTWYEIVVNVCIPNRFASAPLAELICTRIHDSTLLLTTICQELYIRRGEAALSLAILSRVLPSGSEFRGCCNGLFIYARSSNQQYSVCLCNPATRQIVEIPVCSEVYHRCHVSLAFDPCISRHFKLVCFFAIYPYFKLYIYSSETGRWDVHLIPFENYVKNTCIKHIVYLNGIMYCLSAPDLLLSIDLGDLKVCSINLPFKIRDNLLGFIGVSRNHLCYSNRDFFYMFVWRLEGCSDAPNWVLVHKIRIEHLISITDVDRNNSESLMLCAVHPSSGVIFIGACNKIVAYDPHRRDAGITEFLFKKYKLGREQYNFYPYVRCLASLKILEQKDCTSAIGESIPMYAKHATLVDQLYGGSEGPFFPKYQ